MLFRYSWLLAIHELKKIGLLIVALLSGQLLGQQSYFNVPSSDKTPVGTVFFQQQTNCASRMAIGNFTLDLGLSHNLEVGVNVLQLSSDYVWRSIHATTQEIGINSPLLGVNAQKFFPISKQIQFSVGGIVGSEFTAGSLRAFIACYGFSNIKWVSERCKITGGLFTGNAGFLGPLDCVLLSSHLKRVGIELGTELNLCGKTSLIMDFISGNSAMSMTSAGIAQKLAHHWILSGGVLLPNNHIDKPNGIVVELTRAL